VNVDEVKEVNLCDGGNVPGPPLEAGQTTRLDGTLASVCLTMLCQLLGRLYKTISPNCLSKWQFTAEAAGTAVHRS
jgi:hypothetical protein